MSPNPLSGHGPAPRDGGMGLDHALDPELLYERYEPQVERWVRRLAGPGADVEDLAHDVFLVALRRHHEFRGDAEVSTWLFRIVQLTVRKRRFRRRLHDFLYLLFRGQSAALAPRSPTPLEELERRQQCALLYQALDRLPEKYRTPIIMFDIDGRSAAEVASLLGLTVNAVWVRIHRARAKLLDDLSAQGTIP